MKRPLVWMLNLLRCTPLPKNSRFAFPSDIFPTPWCIFNSWTGHVIIVAQKFEKKVVYADCLHHLSIVWWWNMTKDTQWTRPWRMPSSIMTRCAYKTWESWKTRLAANGSAQCWEWCHKTPLTRTRTRITITANIAAALCINSNHTSSSSSLHLLSQCLRLLANLHKWSFILYLAIHIFLLSLVSPKN